MSVNNFRAMDLNMMPSSYMAGLNPEQQRAVETIEGPVLILAGAGTGKTRVLTTRLCHILTNGYAYPSQVLSVTFTNKAAAEMRQRVSTLLSQPVDGMWLGTFHAMGVKILRRNAEAVGLKSNFTILDTDDQLRLLKQIIQAEGIDAGRHPARLFLSLISAQKDRAQFSKIPPHADLLERVYALYQDRLQTLNSVDFGDILLYNIKLFQSYPHILEHYQRQFRYILVDEYQDTNVAQYLWLRLLAQGHQNICCVGDDDQSIYGWRGADVGNILRFEQDFPGAAVIRLEQNYRSSPHILATASGLISKNQGRLGKTLWTKIDEGERVLVKGVYDAVEEARFVGATIERLQRDNNLSLSDIAVLVRASFQTREFEDRFLTLSVPYKVIGGLRFYERQEIRDALAYFRLLVQPEDGLAFERILNIPRRGIGTASLQAVHVLARELHLSLPEAARRLIETDQIRGAARAGFRNFFDLYDRWRGLLHKTSHTELAKHILEESGYVQMWKQDKSPEAPGRLENLKELVRALEEFENLNEFLEHVSLVMEATQNSNQPMITIMTLHAAKGLEFNTVFLTGWEEGIFPHTKALEENGQEGLEEERRLGYVGITRARERAIITYAHNRRTYQGWQNMYPSRFLKELPQDHITMENAFQGKGQSANHAAALTPTSFIRPIQEAQFRVIEYGDISSPPVFPKNSRVRHKKFGSGKVIECDNQVVTVQFDNEGTKKIMADYLQLDA